MDLECAICSDLLGEQPDETLCPPPPPKRSRNSFPQEPGPPPAPELCVPKCGHMFHKRCLVTWIKNNKTCPTCRKALTERQLVTVFLPTASEDKNCRSCENTKNTCDQLTVEKEELKKLYEEVQKKVAELETKKSERLEVDGNRLQQLVKEKAETDAKFLEELRKIGGVQEEVGVEQGAELAGGENEEILGKGETLEGGEVTKEQLQKYVCHLMRDKEDLLKKIEDEREEMNNLKIRLVSVEIQLNNVKGMNDA